ncbi:GntR family transcriptional regulator [Goodfellowiella coeruleoviolacea]|uniref:DNA-binding transcriptional regulator, GntR family n=1 Tax=Goodfellowiella coeruleoviolacea TaxID=334858 RepID=A0AAE3GF85_9PSEU|nr:GntR family transcriptional regulator [Goodfellowiella coeruleoviolacea]MCP2166245.1 DNA-binding transcriptional regulator, GntR family [Goodfellowiella coeruleoviolacea]
MTTARTDDWLGSLARGRVDLGRSSTAERVARLLRARVLEGDLAPGLRLSEEAIGGALSVSRNTLREAFRLLTQDRLLVHEYSRGVFVRIPTEQDVKDLYQARRIIECGALRAWPTAADAARAAVRAAVDEGRQAAEQQRWVQLGTANMRFHEAVAGLAGSERVNEAVDRLLAELRLVFHVMGDPRRFHERYLPWNEEILGLLTSGAVDRAERAMAEYLNAAEEQIVTAYRDGRVVVAYGAGQP